MADAPKDAIATEPCWMCDGGKLGGNCTVCKGAGVKPRKVPYVCSGCRAFTNSAADLQGFPHEHCSLDAVWLSPLHLKAENARLSEALKAANLAHEQIADACTAFGADVSKKDSLDVVLIRCTALMLRIGQALIVSRASLPPESQ